MAGSSWLVVPRAKRPEAAGCPGQASAESLEFDRIAVEVCHVGVVNAGRVLPTLEQSTSCLPHTCHGRIDRPGRPVGQMDPKVLVAAMLADPRSLGVSRRQMQNQRVTAARGAEE